MEFETGPSGGPEGNERLTAWAAVVLVVLLAIEGVTILFLRPLFSVHVFVGMMLIPPVLLKLGSTGYRFARYYTGSGPYTVKGPPHPLMRFVVAPALVISTIGVFATGVWMVAFGRAGPAAGLHKASFVIWACAFAIHLLVYSFRLPRLLSGDLAAAPMSRGRALRGATLAAALTAGAVLAAATYPAAGSLARHRHRDDRNEAARATPVALRQSPPPSAAARVFGLPPVPPGPVPGYVLVADRNANKLLLVSPSKEVVWQFPRPGDVRPGQSFADPDDAFFTPGYRRIVTNEEFNETIAQIDVRRRRIVWNFGRAGVAGAGVGELSHPDDAYVWPDGTLTVADIRNCRVLRLSPAGHVLASIGTAGRCAHDPPRALLDPNGDTPLADGGLLVTEIGGYVDRFDRHDRLLWSIRTPTTYPSDAQLLPNGNVLVAGFNTPGRVDILTPAGKVVWTYGPRSGSGSLDRPSLAVRWPNGMIAVTDDWHHRIVVIDPRSSRIVWQYGHFGIASSADGYLSKPDGLDLLPATVARRAAATVLHVTRVGSLPAPASRLAAVALPDGRILVAGGLVAGSSSDEVLLGPPARLALAGRLPAPTHDAATALFGQAAYLFGGGRVASTDVVVRIDPASGRTRAAGSLGEPLADLGAASAGGRVYLVGGYTGTTFASAVLRFRPGAAPALVARLPAGLRYAGVTSLGRSLFVAGGLTPSGESASVLRIDPSRHTVTVAATLPAAVAHAPLVALDGLLYLVGGIDAHGAPVDRILRIDPESGAVTDAGRLPSPLADAAAVALRGRVIVLGGAGPRPSAAVLALAP